MGKLLFRTLPQYYPEGSIYAQCVPPFPSLNSSNGLTSPASFPFVTPNEMTKHLNNMGILKRYKTLPPPTVPIPHGQSINTFKGVQRVLGDMRTFKTVYSESIDYLTNGHGFFLAFDDPYKHDAARKLFVRALRMDGRMGEWVGMYERTANELIEDRKWVLPGVGRSGTVYVDVVRDVLNIIPVHWVSEEIVSAWISSVLAERTQTNVFRFLRLDTRSNPKRIQRVFILSKRCTNSWLSSSRASATP